MIKEKLTLTGALDIKINDKTVKRVPNLVVTAGKERVASLITGSGNTMSHMAVGTGVTAAAAGDTALVTEIQRNALATAGGTVSGAVVTYEATFAPGEGTGALTEAGIFDAATAGTMLCRTVFGEVNKAAGDSMTITWTLTVS